MERPPYREMRDLKRTVDIMNTHLREHNHMSTSPLDLIMFQFAIEHMSRLSRIMQLPQGHGLVVGMVGSGRSSLAKLVAFVMKSDYHITDGLLRMPAWHALLKSALQSAGIANQKTMLVIRDVCIGDELLLEDVHNLLTQTELATLYAQHEVEAIARQVKRHADAVGSSTPTNTTAECMSKFWRAVWRNLHVLMLFTPSSDRFLERLRLVPTLTTRAIIDWVPAWPEDALMGMASSRLSSFNNSVATLCTKFHLTAREEMQVAVEAGRPCYTSPASFTTLLALFHRVYSDLVGEREELQAMRESTVMAFESVSKFVVSGGLMPSLKRDSAAAQSRLDAAQGELEAISEEYKQLCTAVFQEDLAMQGFENTCKELRADLDEELSSVLPPLREAESALLELLAEDCLSLAELPPKRVPQSMKLLMEALCLLLGIRPGKRGRSIKDYWMPGRKLLSDSAMLVDRLVNFSDMSSRADEFDRIRKHILASPLLYPSFLADVSPVALALGNWLTSLSDYELRTREGLTERVEEVRTAEMELLEMQEKSLQRHKEIEALKSARESKQVEVVELQKSVREMRSVLSKEQAAIARCSRLLRRLRGGRGALDKRATASRTRLQQLLGDVLICTAAVVYLGPLSVSQRTHLVASWKQLCKERGIKCSPDVLLHRVLCSRQQLRSWAAAGLPSSLGVLHAFASLVVSNRFPLVLDEQGTAHAWLELHEKEARLLRLRASQHDLLQRLKAAVRAGRPVLIAGVSGRLPTELDNLLALRTFQAGGITCVRIGSSTVEYNEDFKLYLTCSERKPQLDSSLLSRVLIVDLQLSDEDVMECMLSVLTQVLLPQQAAGLVQLRETTTEAIDALAEAEEKLHYEMMEVDAAQVPRTESVLEAIQLKIDAARALQSAKEAEEDMDEMLRDMLGALAMLMTALYDLLLRFERLDPFVRFPFDTFRQECRVSLEELRQQLLAGSTAAESAEDIVRRAASPGILPADSMSEAASDSRDADEKVDVDIEEAQPLIVEVLPRMLCNRFCHTLAPDLSLALSFSVALLQLLTKGDSVVTPEEWDFFTSPRPCNEDVDAAATGEGDDGDAESASEDDGGARPAWMTLSCWLELNRLSALPRFTGLLESIAADSENWRRVSDAGLSQLPSDWGSRLTAFQRLCVMRCIIPWQLPDAMLNFVRARLGVEPWLPAQQALRMAYGKSTAKEALLVHAADQVAAVPLLEQMGRDQHADVFVAALADEEAVQMIVRVCAPRGDWVVAVGCHEVPQQRLTDIYELLCLLEAEVHPSFRLWLVTDEPLPLAVQHYQTVVLHSSGDVSQLICSYYAAPPLSMAPYCKGTIVEAILAAEARGAVASEEGGSVEVQEKTMRSMRAAKLTFALVQFHCLLQLRLARRGQASQRALPPTDDDLRGVLRFVEDMVIHGDGSLMPSALSGSDLPIAHATFQINAVFHGAHMGLRERRALWEELLRRCLPADTQSKDGHCPVGLSAVIAMLQRDEALQKRLAALAASGGMAEGVAASRAHAFQLLEVFEAAEAAATVDEVAVPSEDASSASGSAPPRSVPPSLREMPRSSSSFALAGSLRGDVSGEGSLRDSLAATVGLSQRQQLLRLCRKELSQLPSLLQLEGERDLASRISVLYIEVGRYNRLLTTIRRSMHRLASALQRSQQLPPAMAALRDDLASARVPAAWLLCSFASKRPLRAYLRELRQRVASIRAWVAARDEDRGRGPHIINWAALFKPRSMLDIAVRVAALNSGLPLEAVQHGWRLAPAGEARLVPPGRGVYLSGVCVQGASWDERRCCLVDRPPAAPSLTSPLPLLWFRPSLPRKVGVAGGEAAGADSDVERDAEDVEGGKEAEAGEQVLLRLHVYDIDDSEAAPLSEVALAADAAVDWPLREVRLLLSCECV
eukprot:PLAT7033.16.p1 GENE.PLAT7033.16~~PLAT7033.16.p1  ORF type:complete len:2120 (+),score=705.71 PLAT7033.16:663-6362(+)